jgi:glutamyl-tRNA synthetase
MTNSPVGLPSKPVVTRFAPSPTGYLHIGGARTALFNWLFAKHHGGKFLLRIEDTDRERSTEGAITAIIDGLKWLELDWHGEPVMQFARADLHAKAGAAMLASGNAYRCYLSQAELADMRAKAEAAKLPFTVNSPWRDRDPKDAPNDIKPTIRLKAPRTGETVVDDIVQGRVTFQNKELDDLIILRSDGVPTYNLAVVVDDHDMGVTHVLRGVDHLTNAARQSQIYAALGWDVPIFGHVPLIHGPDGAKLSKRHGALGIEAYRAMGYLPSALQNYLVRLGWSHGNDEIFSRAEMISWFDGSNLGKSAARMDFKKLEDTNGQYIRAADNAELVRRVREALPEMPDGSALAAKFDKAGWDKFAAIMPGMKERAKTLVELANGAEFLIIATPIQPDEKAAKLLDAEAKGHLAALATLFAVVKTWDAASLEAEVRSFADTTGLKLGKIAQPLRAAITGRAVSPPVFDCMAVLGRDESLARLNAQLS